MDMPSTDGAPSATGGTTSASVGAAIVTPAVATVGPLRPRSLPIGPEKEPINFSVALVGAPPEVEQLVEHIKAVAEQFLYRWKTFPLSEWNWYLLTFEINV